MENKELDLAVELNKLGLTRLSGTNDDPMLLILRTYDGKVFSIIINKNLHTKEAFYKQLKDYVNLK